MHYHRVSFPIPSSHPLRFHSSFSFALFSPLSPLIIHVDGILRAGRPSRVVFPVLFGLCVSSLQQLRRLSPRHSTGLRVWCIMHGACCRCIEEVACMREPKSILPKSILPKSMNPRAFYPSKSIVTVQNPCARQSHTCPCFPLFVPFLPERGVFYCAPSG